MKRQQLEAHLREHGTDLSISGGETGCGLVIEVGALRIEARLVVNPTDLEAFAEGLEGVLSGTATA